MKTKAKQAKQAKQQQKRQKAFPESQVRWWNGPEPGHEQSEPPTFQRWQHDATMDKRVSEIAVSGDALARIYGDNSLGRHVEKLLEGIHELV